MELATSLPPTAEHAPEDLQPDTHQKVIALLLDKRYDGPIPITVEQASIEYYQGEDTDCARRLSCLHIKNEADERRSWLPLADLEELEASGVTTTETHVRAIDIERYAAAQALYAELGQKPELIWES